MILYPLVILPSLPFTELGVAPLLSCGSVVVICGDCGRWPKKKKKQNEKVKHFRKRNIVVRAREEMRRTNENL